jgi:GNAT superfamily N-acetyltransferase
MNDDILLRPAVAGDALCLGVLAIQVFLDTYAPEGIHPPLAREALATGSIEGFAAQLADPGLSIVVAERADALVGFALIRHDARHEQVADPRAAELDRLYVQEPFTGRGVGRALLRAAEDVAAARGATTLWLTAYSGNARALAFYPRCGYAFAGHTVYVIEGRDFPNHLFARPLQAAGDNARAG